MNTIIWEFGVLRCPSQWKLLPWFFTIEKSVKFTWLAFEITCYSLHDIDEHGDL